ncbi:MAG: CDP-alcohol phosphatidyltransferase family protein [Sedimentisphaerales bacterium]|nr:CDP-alcohol phosphatidyltransferase family protein [Sedimentisphaerales bacterium]
MRLNWANRFTILRILLIAPFVSCMLQINDPSLSGNIRHFIRYSAVAIFFLMAISDGLDGFLARKKGQATKLGAFLDPTADKLLITSACLLLASQHSGVEGFVLPPTVVVLIIGKDILIFIGFLIVYFLTGKIRIVPVFAGKASTALQLTMVPAILIAPEASRALPFWGYFVHVLWWSAAAAAVLATLVYIRVGSRFIEQFEQSNNH